MLENCTLKENIGGCSQRNTHVNTWCTFTVVTATHEHTAHAHLTFAISASEPQTVCISPNFSFMGRACRCDISSSEHDGRSCEAALAIHVNFDEVVHVHKWRHFLADLRAATEGRRLRQKEWCRQLGERLKLNGVLLKSVDEVSLMAYRPRVMLSQLHNFKRRQLSCSSLVVPSKFQMLTGLVDMVRLCVGEADGCDCGDASSDVSSTELFSLGWEGVQTFSRTGSAADVSDVEQISSEDDPILILPTDAKRAELDMTELEEMEKLFVTPTTKEHVLMDVEPSETSAHSSTLQSWPMSHAELASLVAEEVAGPSSAEYASAIPKKAKIKPSLLKRPCAVVRSPLANVGLARTARCRPEIDSDNPPCWMQKLAADGKALPRHTLFLRIHSKAWHLLFDFVLFVGGATDVAKQEAGAFARKATALWRSLLAAESKWCVTFRG